MQGLEDKVQFEGEATMQPEIHSPLEEKPATGLAKLLVDKGVAANKKSAEVLLIAVATFFLLVATIVLLFLLLPDNQNIQLNPNTGLNS